MADHDFRDDQGRGYSAEILEVHDTDGQVWTAGDMAEHFSEADRVFYSVEALFSGETFYRWVGGPFEDESDVYDAIEDEGDFYS